MRTKNVEGIVVEYYGDPTKMIDDHNSEPNYLTEINERRFGSVFNAIKFLGECISPITTVEDIIPDSKKPKGFKLVLPDKNIKIQHQATNCLENEFYLNLDEDVAEIESLWDY